jgi:hypothetical protein
MQFVAAVFGGIAASAIFWLLDKYLFTFPQPYQVAGIVVCFLLFGGVGYWLALRQPAARQSKAGTRVASSLKGRNVTVTLDGVSATGDTSADVLTDIGASRDINARAKDVEIKS